MFKVCSIRITSCLSLVYFIQLTIRLLHDPSHIQVDIRTPATDMLSQPNYHHFNRKYRCNLHIYLLYIAINAHSVIPISHTSHTHLYIATPLCTETPVQRSSTGRSPSETPAQHRSYFSRRPSFGPKRDNTATNNNNEASVRPVPDTAMGTRDSWTGSFLAEERVACTS